VLSNVETSAQHTESGMQDALQDLEALMVKAKDMVKLAADLNERLTAATAASNAISAADAPPVEPEEATFIRSSLTQLGLQMTNAPVTLDMIKDERRWIEELARELANVLQGTGDARLGKAKEGLMAQRGIIGLDEAWGGWNRARGVGKPHYASPRHIGFIQRHRSAGPPVDVPPSPAATAAAHRAARPDA
jgi:ESCRT-II complex subunit VPS36